MKTRTANLDNIVVGAPVVEPRGGLCCAAASVRRRHSIRGIRKWIFWVIALALSTGVPMAPCGASDSLPPVAPQSLQSPPGAGTTNDVQVSRTSPSHRPHLIQAADLRAKLETGVPADRPLVMDVRPQAAFAACRIAGAFNLPLSLIKTKAFYKNRQIVLVNDGHNDAVLQEEAARLQAAGFRHVRVLEGGLVAWRTSGGPLVGEKPEDSSWAIVSPPEAHEVLAQPGWRVIDAGPIPNSAARSFFTNVVHVPFNGNAAGFITAPDAQPPPGPGVVERILITEISHADFQQLLQAAEAGRDPSRYYFLLEGGAAAYGEFLTQQSRIQNRRTGTLANQGLSDRSHRFESSAPGKSCCGGGK